MLKGACMWILYKGICPLCDSVFSTVLVVSTPEKEDRFDCPDCSARLTAILDSEEGTIKIKRHNHLTAVK